MFGNLDLTTLQHIWWLLCSVVGSLFLFLTFVQGGQSLLWQVAKTDTEKSLIINSLGRKWELTFTTLVLFGGALFAAFPKFYATVLRRGLLGLDPDSLHLRPPGGQLRVPFQARQPAGGEDL